MQREQLRLCSCVKVQSMYRGYLCRKNFTQTTAAIQIQSSYRQCAAQKKLAALKKAKAVGIIQRYHRGYSGRKSAQRLRLHMNSANNVQRVFRGYLIRLRMIEALEQRERESKRMQELKQREVAALTLQRVTRGNLERRNVALLRVAKKEHHAAVNIQRVARGNMERRNVALLRIAKKEHHAAINIQRMLRGHAARKKCERSKLERQERLRIRDAASTKLQAVVRGHLIRRAAADLALMAIIIQREWRAHKERCLIHLVQHGVTQLQSAVRGQQARAKLIRMIHAVIVIQRAQRRRIAYFQELCNLFERGVVLLQAHFRGIIARQQFMRLLELNMPDEELMDSVFLTHELLRQLLFGNRNTLMKIFKGYIKYPEQCMTSSSIIKFAQHFNVMPKLLPRRDLEDLVDLVTYRNKHKEGQTLISFEQYLKLLMLISLRYVDIKDFSTFETNRDDEIRKLHLKLSALFEWMDKTDGKRKVAESGRINENLAKFILADDAKLPQIEKAMRVNIVTNKSSASRSPGQSFRTPDRINTRRYSTKSGSDLKRRTPGSGRRSKSNLSSVGRSPPSGNRRSNSNLSSASRSPPSGNRTKSGASFAGRARSRTPSRVYASSRSPNYSYTSTKKPQRRLSQMSMYSDAFSVESDGSLGMDDFNDLGFDVELNPSSSQTVAYSQKSNSKRGSNQSLGSHGRGSNQSLGSHGRGSNQSLSSHRKPSSNRSNNRSSVTSSQSRYDNPHNGQSGDSLIPRSIISAVKSTRSPSNNHHRSPNQSQRIVKAHSENARYVDSSQQHRRKSIQHSSSDSPYYVKPTEKSRHAPNFADMSALDDVKSSRIQRFPSGAPYGGKGVFRSRR